MIGYFDAAYAGKVVIYIIIVLLFGWFVTACVAHTVLTWERIIASDAADDAPIEETHEHEEQQFIG